MIVINLKYRITHRLFKYRFCNHSHAKHSTLWRFVRIINIYLLNNIYLDNKRRKNFKLYKTRVMISLEFYNDTFIETLTGTYLKLN